jgi:hypothetical protein
VRWASSSSTRLMAKPTCYHDVVAHCASGTRSR